MNNKLNEIVLELIKNNKTISTMESCTGGFITNEITNIEGASEVLKFSAVTYSNEYKIKMGVEKNIIDKYSVYSRETAAEMSKKISDYTTSNYGIGITGKLNRIDKYNDYGEDNKVYLSIYDRDNKKYYNEEFFATKSTRRENKELVLDLVVNILTNIINKENLK